MRILDIQGGNELDRTYPLFSADSHLEVPYDYWAHWIAEPYRDRAPQRVRLPHGGDAYMVQGQLIPPGGTANFAGHSVDEFDPRIVRYDESAGAGPPQQRLREQDADGVDGEVLYPDGGGSRLRLLSLTSRDDREGYLAVIRGYNDFLAKEYCAAAPDRLIGVGVLPNVGADEDVREMERCARMGIKGFALGTLPSGRSYPTPEDDPFWAAAVDLTMPITVHTSMAGSRGRRDEPSLLWPTEPEGLDRPPIDIIDRLARYGTRHCGCLEAAQLIMAGVFDHFPKLRIYWAENQIGWIPIWLEQMDLIYEANWRWVARIYGWKPLSQRPSDYVREFTYWGFFDDPAGIRMRHDLGVDRIMWGSDFPHEVSHWPRSAEVMQEQLAGVPEAEKRSILRDNARQFFHLK